MNLNKNEPRILLFDIETAPNVSYTWGKYDQNVIEFKQEWYIMSFAYKWLDEDKVVCHALPEYKSYKKDREDDKELVKELHKLFNEADMVIAHNGDEFDIKKANARFIYHGLNPPAPYKTVDTKKIAKNNFKFNSNSLTDLGQHLGLGEKLPTGGFSLWKGCMSGDKKSWDTMIKYNKQDVKLLEQVYLKLRPWHKTHPNLGHFAEEKHSCPKCGSTHLQSRGLSKTLSSIYRRFQCQGCGAWSRAAQSEKGTRVKVTNL